GHAVPKSGASCRLMVSQLVLSVADLTGSTEPSVELADGTGERCSSGLSGTTQYSAPQVAGGSGMSEYYVDTSGRIVSVRAKLDAAPVVGPLGDGKVRMRSVGVRLDEKAAAAVSADGRKLYLSRLDHEQPLQLALTSGATKGTGADSGFAAP